jgi:phospholipid transport system substrate-binding protein
VVSGYRIMTSVRTYSRRGLLGLAASAILAGSAAARAKAPPEHPSLVYMRQVARDLLEANRQGTVMSFRRAILRHADLADIANYSLGQYQDKLPSSQRNSYYGGVATFIARYFADQSREYRVAKYELGEPTRTTDNDILISSDITMMSGSSYTVVWRLAWRANRYRVTDARVLGFSMVYLQRGLFTSYIAKKNGDVGQLVTALNR